MLVSKHTMTDKMLLRSASLFRLMARFQRYKNARRKADNLLNLKMEAM